MKDAIYINLCEFLEMTNQYRVAGRWDCINYCVGYYGSVGPDHLAAINALHRNGLIKG